MYHSCERCESPLARSDDDCASCAEHGARVGEPWLGRLLDKRFRVLRRIGRGASSRVLHVRDTRDGRDLAMKLLRRGDRGSSESFDRFMREARVLNRVHHPSIVEVVDVGELEDGHVYLMMELVEGESLADVLRRGRVSQAMAFRVARDLALALHAVHAEGVAHRDLKPSNVLLRGSWPGDGTAMLVDFGIASLEHAVSITGPDQRLGTPGYMAPEYLREGLASSQSDQYSLGVLLYEMLSARMPFEASSPGRLLMKQTREAPTPLRTYAPEASEALEALVMRALQREAARRFDDCAAFATAIESWFDVPYAEPDQGGSL